MELAHLEDCSVIKPEYLSILMCSDYIVVPATVFNNNQIPPLLFEIKGNKKSVVGAAYICHYGTKVYVPPWIYNFLEGGTVTLATYMPSLLAKVIVQPHMKELLDFQINELQAAFQNYTMLQKGTTIPIKIQNTIIYVEIKNVEPDNAGKLLGSNVYFEFLPSVNTFVPFTGIGRRLGK
jgi:hypothetical protein